MQRIITAVVLVAVLLLVFFVLPRSAALGVLGLFMALAVWEWSGFLSIPRWRGRLLYVLLIGIVFAGSMWLLRGQLTAVFLVSLIWWLVAFFWVLRYPTPIPRQVGAVCGALVIVPAWLALITLLESGERGPAYVLFVLSVVWAADVGAYFVGRRFGRTKLAPQVSPGKTWEGVAGGLVFAGLAAAIGGSWLGWSLVMIVPVGLSVAAVSIVGDLTVSMFKRSAGLKDSGNLFPGHGGMLDRVDSVTAAVPLFTLQAIWLGLI
jgi:phosphatidate cytidylyltransferase